MSNNLRLKQRRKEREKIKIDFLSLPFIMVISVAFINHILTFLAYDWYAGIDSYSYDLCGLQLVSGRVFDPFPILFRAPLIPIMKNIIYLIFEGHPYALSILMHSLGVVTTILAYRLGTRFNKAVGFALGMLMALNLPISVHFQHISVPTFFIPLLILAADCFVVWVKKPDRRSLVLVTIVTIICYLARTEALILVPIFWIMGWIGHRLWKHATVFLISCLLVYNFVSFLYYTHFGYWGISYNTGWAIFTRVARANDKQFDISNGPASKKVGEYMSKEWWSKSRGLGFSRRQMFSLNLAQKELGFIEADRLFKQAAIEAINSDPGKFAKFTFLRILGQLDLYYTPGLSFKEFPYETESGHMWGFEEKRMQGKRADFKKWSPIILRIESPFRWERQAIKARLARMCGVKTEITALPVSFRLGPNVMVSKAGGVDFLNCEDGVMGERLWGCRDLDAYFFLKYWGQKEWSKGALRILKYWDMLMPRPKIRMNIHRIMWALWIVGIFLSRERWRSISLTALLLVMLSYAACLCVFTDNFGGRLALYDRAYLWLGAFSGIQALSERIKVLKHLSRSDDNNTA